MQFIVPLLVALGLAAGFLREIVIAYNFGVGIEVEVFRVATGLPTALSEAMMLSLVSLLLGSVQSTDGGTLENRIFRIYLVMTCFAVSVVLIGVIAMPLLSGLLAPGFTISDQVLVTRWGRFAWLIFLFSVLGSPMRALLSSRGVIWPGAAAQLVRSAAFLTILLSFGLVLQQFNLSALVISAVAAPLFTILCYVFILRSYFRSKNLRMTMERFSRNEILLLSSLYSLVGIQILLASGRIVERSAASLFGTGSVATLEYSFAVLMACASFFSASVSIAVAPRIAKSYQKCGVVGMPEIKIVFLAIAAASLAGLLLRINSEFVVSSIFERGSFDADAVLATSNIFRVHSLALGPIVAVLLLNQTMILTGAQNILYLTAIIKLMIRGGFAFGTAYADFPFHILAYGVLISELFVAVVQVLILDRRGMLRKN